MSLASALACACTLVACSRKPTSAVVPARASEQLSAAIEKTAGPHGERKKKDADVPVFVDGKQLATLRFGELPSTLVARASRFYRISDYLTALGVPTARVRAVHVRGNGHRVSSIEGDELAHGADRFVFDFMERDAGIAKTRWDTTGLRNTFRVDEIRELFVFVDKAVPSLDSRRSCYLEPAEQPNESPICSIKVPYAAEEPAKGTRVYLDGRLIGQVKRRRLSDDLVVGVDPSGAHRFALVKLLQSFGVDASHAKGVELVSGDDVVGRGELGGNDIDRAMTFVLPAHRHGRVLMRVPSRLSSPIAQGERDAEVTAVLVYQTTPPSKRSLSPIPDAPPPEDNVLVDDG